jgi:hypothetical protein
MRPWLETCGDADVARLLRAGRPTRALQPLERERSRRKLGAFAPTSRGRRFLAAFSTAAGGFFWVQHAALGAVLGALLAAAVAPPGVVRFFSGSSAEQPPAVRPRPVEERATSPASAPAVPAALPPALSASPSTALVPVRAVPPTPSATGATFERELALLERARRELQGNPAAALRWLEVHRTDFANGPLSVEREFLAVAALVRLGRTGEARARAAALRARTPGSLYGERLQRLLGDAPGPK